MLTDEITLLKKTDTGFIACTLTKWIKISEHAKTMLFGDDNRGYPISGEEYIIMIDEICDNKLSMINDINHLFILEKTNQAETRIEKAKILEVIPELFPVTLRIQDNTRLKASFVVLMDLLGVIKCSKICFGTDMGMFTFKMKEVLK